MNSLWIGLGRVLYWLLYLPLAVFFRFTKRTRVLIICGDRVLMVRPWLGNGRWQMPGGGIKFRQQPAMAAQREVQEETGIVVPIERLTVSHARIYRRGLWRYPYELFTVALDEALVPQGRRPEIVECAWLPFSALTPKNTSFDTLEALLLVR